MTTKKEKTFPQVGEHVYLRQFTGDYWVDMVKSPYTVIAVSKKEVLVQAARLHFATTRYFDTVASSITEDTDGYIERLTWHPKKGLWGTSNDSYPEFMIVGFGYQHQPYLN